jgi:Mrp family chromosome partitioning ATPase
MTRSSKGGVGKSTIAANLAAALRRSGKRVGLLDIDIHGPSVPTMLGLEGHPIRGSEDGLLPVIAGGLKVMSIGFLLRDQDDAVIWRGPMKMGAIKQLLKDVVWGDLDYLIRSRRQTPIFKSGGKSAWAFLSWGPSPWTPESSPLETRAGFM